MVNARDKARLGYPFNRTWAYAGWMERPLASIHYPKSLGEFRAWFPTDADCLDYLEWLRWPHGFVCPSCGHSCQFASKRDPLFASNRDPSVSAGLGLSG